MTESDSAPSATREISELPRVAGGLPLAGNLLQLEPERLHLQLEEWAERYGDFYTFALGPKTTVVVRDMELANKMLRERPKGFRRMSGMLEVLGEMGIAGVFTAEGKEWLRQRKLVMPAFNPAGLRASHATIALSTRRLHGLWHRAAQTSAAIDALRDVMRYTVDVTGALAFGEDLNTLEAGAGELQRHMASLFTTVNRRLSSPFPYWRYVTLPSDREFKKSLAEVEGTILAIVQRARAALLSEPHREPKNVLEAMIVAHDADDPSARLSDRELYGNVLTLLLAGEDTTANTIAWMLYYMAEHREVQRRMAAEADALPDACGVPENPEAAHELRYIAAVVQETLRLKSPAPVLFLEPIADTVLGDIRVPAGTPLIALSRALALQPGAFHAPLAFDPTRWLGTPAGKHDPRASLAFGAGPRVCPGRSLALLESTMVGAMVARCFDVTLASTAPVYEKFDFTVRPANLRIRLTPRAPA